MRFLLLLGGVAVSLALVKSVKVEAGAPANEPAPSQPTADDLMLVDLMNEMIELRTQLDSLRAELSLRTDKAPAPSAGAAWSRWRRRMKTAESAA